MPSNEMTSPELPARAKTAASMASQMAKAQNGKADSLPGSDDRNSRLKLFPEDAAVFMPISPLSCRLSAAVSSVLLCMTFLLHL